MCVCAPATKPTPTWSATLQAMLPRLTSGVGCSNAWVVVKRNSFQTVKIFILGFYITKNQKLLANLVASLHYLYGLKWLVLQESCEKRQARCRLESRNLQGCGEGGGSGVSDRRFGGRQAEARTHTDTHTVD